MRDIRLSNDFRESEFFEQSFVHLSGIRKSCVRQYQPFP